jgi:hypothetical protein
MQDRDVYSILGKPLSVLPKTYLLKPIRNLLHCGLLRILRYPFLLGASGPGKQNALIMGRFGHCHSRLTAQGLASPYQLPVRYGV